MKTFASCWLALALVLCASASVVAAQAAVPPDVVQLASGGMVRGTIVEAIPGDHVTIQLVTGEVRVISSPEITYAGPTGQAPQAAPLQEVIPAAPMTPPPPPRPRGVHLHVSADEGAGELTLQEVVGSATAVVSTGRGFATVSVDQFAPMCTAPCDLEVSPRAYRLGISQGQGDARRADHNLFTIDHDMGLHLEYESREGARIAGWIVFIGGMLAGGGVMLGGLGDDRNLLTWIIAGSVIFGVSEIIGFALIFLNDHADIRELGDGIRF
ncbi:MAG: hypothetical protein U0234_11555 [Sandaracinus sp.]